MTSIMLINITTMGNNLVGRCSNSEKASEGEAIMLMAVFIKPAGSVLVLCRASASVMANSVSWIIFKQSAAFGNME